MLLQYKPPHSMQTDQIWSLVLNNSRQHKVPEYYYTKKKMPLLSWAGAMDRYSRYQGRYAPVIGIVSQNHIVIDVDQSKLPDSIVQLLKAYPTLSHLSKSGEGHRVVYTTDKPLPKKFMTFKQGEIYCGAFVTMNDNEQSDFSSHNLSSIDPDTLASFIPELSVKLKPSKPNHPLKHESQYQDADKLLQEARTMLSIIPADVTPLLETTYELRMPEFELNSYTHWLLVSHALADLYVGVSRDYDLSAELQQVFIEWSRTGASFVSDEDCEERWSRSCRETIEAEKSIITFSTLRKLYWGYRIPIEEFPKLKFDKLGHPSVDTTDPRNFEFLTQRLKLTLARDFYTGNVYVRGPKAIIKHYFSSKRYEFFTSHDPHLSMSFPSNYRNDEDLLYRFVNIFRDFGISGASKSQPLLSGLYLNGEELIDTLYIWMKSKPWDGVPRVKQIIKDSVKLDPTKILEDAGEEFYHNLIFKHCMHMAGLRAKAHRYLLNKEVPEDRFKRAQGILIMAGYQGMRKTTWVECLLPSQADAVNSVTPSSMKDTLEMQRALAGAFVLNIDEVDAVLDKIGMSDFKNVLTQEKDTYRVMYTQQFKSYPRAAGFFGTTNKLSLRLDRTGNRRIWIIPVLSCDASPLINCDYQQFWAEALYHAEKSTLETWNLTPQETNYLNANARNYAKQSKGELSLEMMYLDEIYTHEDIDFKLLLESFTTKLQRFFSQKNVLVPLRGQKAYTLARNKGFLNNQEFDLKSFNYVIQDFICNVTGLHNEIVYFNGKHFFRDGCITYRPGARTYKYYLIPFKEAIDDAIAQELLPSEVKIN